MATSVVFNGVNYSVPAFGDVGYAQGPGNLSAYLISIATGTLQATGGLFSLTSDANFGPNFGLVSIYYKSASPNIATAGVLRLAHADTIDWRNNANTLNLPLGVNASDQLTYNGVIISTVVAGGTVNPGTQFQLAYYATTTNAVSGLTLITPNRALISDSNGLPIASVTTATELGFVSGVTSAIQTQLNAKATDSLVVHLAGIETITGAKTFNAGAGAITLSGSTIAMGANKITGLANGTVATDAAAFGQIIGSFVAPTVQKFLSGSGTYTTPTSPRSPLYIRIRAVGGGGGGGGSGTAGGANPNGGAGGNTTFGTSLIVASGGVGGFGGGNSAPGAGGGTASLGTSVGIALSGGSGSMPGTDVAVVNGGGGTGGNTPFGGGAGANYAGIAGAVGATNTGGGASGGACGGVAAFAGGGGGGGGFVDAIITSPIATYAYAIGAGGIASTAGTSGAAGGVGGSGAIIVEEFYQ